MQYVKAALAEALARFCARAAEKLRAQGSQAGYVSVFLRTNPHRPDLAQYQGSLGVKLVHSSADSRELTRVARRCLEQLYKSGFAYKKVGVCLSELQPATLIQGDLLNPLEPEKQQRAKVVMETLDTINRRYGKGTLKLAAEGLKPASWVLRSDYCSPSYTTQWQDLPVVRC